MGKRIFTAFMSLAIFLYRLTGGKFMGEIAGLHVLLLSTTGRKTGKQRTTPLGYFNENGDYVIIASNAGAEANPGWFYNLKDASSVVIEVERQRLTVKPEVVGHDKRAQFWAKLVAMAPGYAGYEHKTSREIPLILLHPVTS
jgi:deazaflavin-dependent oxidoreductase (nitroreductase family)